MKLKNWIGLTILLCVKPVFANDNIVTKATQKNYNDVKSFMHELVRTHPNTTRTVIIGASDSGETIEGVAIGQGELHNLVVATHHGNEYGSTEVSMAFAKSLAENPIPAQTIYVIPVLNIAGFNRGDRDEAENGHYRDPNRDYPGPCGTEGPHRLKSTAALAKFIEHENIITSATLHTFHPAVVYPWGFAAWNTTTLYDDIFTTIVNNATVLSRYKVGNSGKVIYPVAGTFEDYAYWKHGIWSILFELGSSHSPSTSAIAEMVRVNVPGLREMFEQAPTVRAVNHEFSGGCLFAAMKLDKHDE